MTFMLDSTAASLKRPNFFSYWLCTISECSFANVMINGKDDTLKNAEERVALHAQLQVRALGLRAQYQSLAG